MAHVRTIFAILGILCCDTVFAQVTPSSGVQGATLAVTVEGSGFVSGHTALVADNPGISVSSLTVIDANHLNATLVLTAAPGPAFLTVITDGVASSQLQFDVTASPLGAAAALQVRSFAGQNYNYHADGVGTAARFRSLGF